MEDDKDEKDKKDEKDEERKEEDNRRRPETSYLGMWLNG